MSNDPYNRRPLGYESATNPAPPPPGPPPLVRMGSRRWSVRAWPFGLIRIVWTFTGVLLLVMLLVAPAVEPTFRNNRVELPAASAALFAISGFLRRTYLWVLPAILGAALPFLIAAWAAMTPYDDGRRLRIRLASGLLLLVGIGLTVWVVLGLFLPYTKMLENLTSGR